MLHQLSRFGLVVVLGLVTGQPVMAQPGGNAGQGIAQDEQLVKPTGPAAKKADELIRGYTARIETEIGQDRKELERLRAELKELIDLRYEMATAIAEIRGDLAAKGTYSGDPVVMLQGQADAHDRKTAPPQQGPMQGITFRRDFFYGLGSALPKEPSPEQLEQLRRLAPRADLKRMIKDLRAEVEATRTEVDQLAYKLLELRAGIVSSQPGVFGGMGGGMGGGGPFGPWFGSMGSHGMGMR
jgi:DNA repair exonuclease SbcCD ATPase subunit